MATAAAQPTTKRKFVIESPANSAATPSSTHMSTTTEIAAPTDVRSSLEEPSMKKPKRNNHAQDKEEEVTKMKDKEFASSTTAIATASTFNYVEYKEAISTRVREPLPNVLADMVMDYLFHPLFDLWEEIISVYESLPQIPTEENETMAPAADNNKKKAPKQKKKEQIELMPKLRLSPPASPMEVDELEQQFQLKYDDPNFHFSSDLKFLWSIADGLECSQNHIFNGRFWPSLTTMSRILECPDDSYYVMNHTDSSVNHSCDWLKYDFRSGVIYWNGSGEDHEDPFEEDEIVIIFHSLTHFLRALLATLKRAHSGDLTVRHQCFSRWEWESANDQPILAHRVERICSFVPQPPHMEQWTKYSPNENLYVRDVLHGCPVQSADMLVPGHFTSAEYLSIRISICGLENVWMSRLMSLKEAAWDAKMKGEKEVYVPYPFISDCHDLNDANPHNL